MMLPLKKHPFLLAGLFLLTALKQEGDAADYSFREEFLEQQRKNTHYHCKQYKKMPEFQPDTLGRKWDFSSGEGKFIAFLMLASLLSPLQAEPVSSSAKASSPRTASTFNQNDQSYFNQTLSYQGISNKDSALQNFPQSNAAPSIKNLIGFVQSINDKKDPRPSKIKAEKLQPLPLLKRKEVYDQLEGVFRVAQACEPDTKREMEENKLQLLAVKRWGGYQEQAKNCRSLVKSWAHLKPKIKSKEFLIDDNSPTAIVNQRQYAVADYKSRTPVLLTANLMKCIGLALFNPEIKKGGLAHIDGENIRSLDEYLKGNLNTANGLTDLQQYLLDVAEIPPRDKIHATLVSGSSAHINYVMEYLKMQGVKEFKIVLNLDWGKKENSYFNNNPKGSVAIDCRSGRLWKIKNDSVISQLMGPPPLPDEEPKPLLKIELS